MISTLIKNANTIPTIPTAFSAVLHGVFVFVNAVAI
jgi:hypothetical protein